MTKNASDTQHRAEPHEPTPALNLQPRPWPSIIQDMLDEPHYKRWEGYVFMIQLKSGLWIRWEGLFPGLSVDSYLTIESATLFNTNLPVSGGFPIETCDIYPDDIQICTFWSNVRECPFPSSPPQHLDTMPPPKHARPAHHADPIPPSCADCRYAVEDEGPTFACHRLPPAPVRVGPDEITLWPTVSKDNWCGEFKPNP